VQHGIGESVVGSSLHEGRHRLRHRIIKGG
jgi:hypothetical protein